MVGDVRSGNHGRAIVALIVVLAVADAAAWGFLFKSRPAGSTYVSTAASSSLPPLNASPTPSASAPSRAAPTTAALSLALPKPAGQALNVAIVGDDLAVGRYASSPDSRYRQLMLTALRNRGPVNLEVAYPTGSGGPSTAKTAPSDLDLMVVELGTDDMTSGTLALFTAGYDAYLVAVRAASPKAALICAGTWSHTGQAYDVVIEHACGFEGGRFVSLAALYGVASNRGPAGVTGFYGTSDDSAPNDAGHRAIAEALLAPIGLTVSP